MCGNLIVIYVIFQFLVISLQIFGYIYGITQPMETSVDSNSVWEEGVLGLWATFKAFSERKHCNGEHKGSVIQSTLQPVWYSNHGNFHSPGNQLFWNWNKQIPAGTTSMVAFQLWVKITCDFKLVSITEYLNCSLVFKGSCFFTMQSAICLPCPI